MTKEEKDTLTKEIKDLQEWMKDSCGENVREYELPKRNDEYSNPMVEDLSAMVKEVGDRFGFRLQSAIQSTYPKGLPITSSIPMLNPQGSLYLNYGAQHGETVEHDFIKSLNNEKEKQ